MIASEESIARVTGLVKAMETISGRPWPWREDLVAEGLVGLSEALGRYDCSKAASPWSFAYLRVRGRIIDSIRRKTKRRGPRPHVCAQPGGSLTGQATAYPRGPETWSGMMDPVALPVSDRTLESAMTAREAALLLARLLRTLPYRQRHLVVECGIRRRPVEQARRDLNLTRNRASRLLNRALEQIRTALEEEGYSLSDFV